MPFRHHNHQAKMLTREIAPVFCDIPDKPIAKVCGEDLT